MAVQKRVLISLDRDASLLMIEILNEFTHHMFRKPSKSDRDFLKNSAAVHIACLISDQIGVDLEKIPNEIKRQFRENNQPDRKIYIKSEVSEVAI